MLSFLLTRAPFLEKNAAVLLSEPHSLAPVLTSVHLLSPSTDIKVKHGVIGFLKHLAQSSVQSPEIHTTLGNAGVVQIISECGIWDEKADAMAEVVQISAIGVLKHLCNNIRKIFARSTYCIPLKKSIQLKILLRLCFLLQRHELQDFHKCWPL